MQGSRKRTLDAVFDALEGREADLGRALFALEVGPALRRMPGRETFVVDLTDPARPRPLGIDGDAAGAVVEARCPAVVKRFEGSDGAEARAELLRGRMPRSPARREAENLMALAGLGFAVPMVLYFAESGLASLVVLEYVAHRRHLRDGSRPTRAEALALAGLAAELHAAGWYHRDLYLNHVVETAEGELVLLDLGRARHARRPRRRWFEKDLGALLASSPLGLDGAADPRGLRFLVHYFTVFEAAAEERGAPVRPPATRRAKRRFLRGVVRRARHMRSHVPRHDHVPEA